MEIVKMNDIRLRRHQTEQMARTWEIEILDAKALLDPPRRLADGDHPAREPPEAAYSASRTILLAANAVPPPNPAITIGIVRDFPDMVLTAAFMTHDEPALVAALPERVEKIPGRALGTPGEIRGSHLQDSQWPRVSKRAAATAHTETL